MKRNSKLSVAILFLLAIASGVKAQQPLPCGKYRIDTAAENKAMKFQLLRANRTGAVNYLVRVYFHVCANDDGSNAPINTAQIATEFTTLLNSYAADNICFLNAGTDYINNTNLNLNFNADNDPNGTAFNSYQVPGCINCFYLQVINGNNSACNPPCGYGGIALGGIPGTFYLVSAGNIGQGASVSHEMGHCLGLLHTFEPNNGHEDINGGNGNSAADKVADTPADPFVFNGNDCYKTSVNKCLYTGTCTDPNGASNYNPPYTNLMAYWWNNGCYPNLAATNGQFMRANSFLGSSEALINCSSPLDVTQTAITVSSGYFMKSAINSFTTNGNVLLDNSVKAVLGGSRVALEPGFHANPSGGGLVDIKVKPCN